MSSKFIVLSLPRSRSAWLAHWLSYPGKLVGHDIGVETKSVDQFLKHFEFADGSVETGAMIGWRLLRHHVPNLKTLVVLRDPAEVLQSMQNKGLILNPAIVDEIFARRHMLNAIAMSKDVKTIRVEELDSKEIRMMIFEWLLDVPWDEEWDSRYAHTKIEIDFRARILQLAKNHDDLERLKTEIVSRQQKIGLAECPMFH